MSALPGHVHDASTARPSGALGLLPQSRAATLPKAAARFLTRLRLLLSSFELPPILCALKRLVAPRGHVYIVSPFSWMEEYTARGRWLSPEQLEDKMGTLGFSLKMQRPEALLIRDHARKFQFIVSHGMLFQRGAR